MKMADGGFPLAYNVQFSTDTNAQVIVGVEVATCGSDQGQMAPMKDRAATAECVNALARNRGLRQQIS